MEDVQKPKWDYVLCNLCPAKESEYFVLGDDVGKPGVGVCPTCGTEIFHVRCDSCGEERELDKSCEELDADNPGAWTCLTCKTRMPLPTEKINIVKSLPPELEQEFKEQGAVMRSKLKKIMVIAIIAIAGFVILLLK
jgi:hypothetical protein